MSDATLNYIELPAADLVATKTFYTAAFGWEWQDFGPTYAASRSGSVEIGLNGLGTPAPRHDAGAQNSIGPLLLMATEDLAAAEAGVRDAGGTVISPAYGYPGGRRFHFVDPGGNILGIYQSDS